jgi:hypothetical protein
MTPVTLYVQRNVSCLEEAIGSVLQMEDTESEKEFPQTYLSIQTYTY